MVTSAPSLIDCSFAGGTGLVLVRSFLINRFISPFFPVMCIHPELL